MRFRLTSSVTVTNKDVLKEKTKHTNKSESYKFHKYDITSFFLLSVVHSEHMNFSLWPRMMITITGHSIFISYESIIHRIGGEVEFSPRALELNDQI